MDFFLEIDKLFYLKNWKTKVFQAAHLLPCHCSLVFKNFFATPTILWTHLQPKLYF